MTRPLSLSIRDMRERIGEIARGVGAGLFEEVVITDSGSPVSVAISMADYERLHHHADLLAARQVGERIDSGAALVAFVDVATELDATHRAGSAATDSITVHPAAVAELRDLPHAAGAAVVAMIANQADRETRQIPARIEGLAQVWRIRFGPYRVLFSLDQNRREMTVLSVAARRDTYVVNPSPTPDRKDSFHSTALRHDGSAQ